MADWSDWSDDGGEDEEREILNFIRQKNWTEVIKNADFILSLEGKERKKERFLRNKNLTFQANLQFVV